MFHQQLKSLKDNVRAPWRKDAWDVSDAIWTAASMRLKRHPISRCIWSHSFFLVMPFPSFAFHSRTRNIWWTPPQLRLSRCVMQYWPKLLSCICIGQLGVLVKRILLWMFSVGELDHLGRIRRHQKQKSKCMLLDLRRQNEFMKFLHTLELRLVWR